MERNTVQKIIIKNKLMNNKTHPTAEQVYELVKKEMPTITLATVYRNLNKMFENNEIIRLEVNGEYHFDAETNPHLHFVCDVCGKIIDYEDDAITKRILKISREKNFRVRETDIIIRGVCEECLGRG